MYFSYTPRVDFLLPCRQFTREAAAYGRACSEERVLRQAYKSTPFDRSLFNHSLSQRSWRVEPLQLPAREFHIDLHVMARRLLLVPLPRHGGTCNDYTSSLLKNYCEMCLPTVASGPRPE
jgi:hypothetical protein